MDGADAPIRRKPTINQIQRSVCGAYGVSLPELVGENRESRIAHPRQIACYLTRNMTGFSYPHIAQYFGDRDHTTIMFACRQVEARIAKDASLRDRLDDLKGSILDAAASRPVPEHSKPPKKVQPGAVWSEVEIISLTHLWGLRYSVKEIGSLLTRHTQRAIYSKAHKLGLPMRDGDTLTASIHVLPVEAAA